MNIELRDYIEVPIQEKLRAVITTVSKNLPEDPVEVFVSTSLSQNGPTILSAWLFTERVLVEIRNPLSHERIQCELAPFKDAVDWIRLNARRYDFENTAPESELELEFTTKDGLTGLLSAAGQGCTHLMEIYRCRFLKNFTGTLKE